MKNILLNSDMSHLDLDHPSDFLFSQIPLYLIKHLSTAIRNYGGHAQKAIKCPEYCLFQPLLGTFIFPHFNHFKQLFKEETHVKVFFVYFLLACVLMRS